MLYLGKQRTCKYKATVSHSIPVIHQSHESDFFYVCVDTQFWIVNVLRFSKPKEVFMWQFGFKLH